ncbi:MAG: TRAP transporter small permease [Rubrivivax sp.]
MAEPSVPPPAALRAATPPAATAVGRFERVIVAANRAALIALMAAMALLVMVNVIARYVFNHSFVWAEEISRYMMVWVGFLGAGLVLRVGAHIAVDVFQDMLPRRAAQAMRAGVVAVFGTSLVAMLWLGIEYVLFAWGQETPVLNWNFGVIYIAIPVGALLMLVHLALVAGPYVRAREFRKDPEFSGEEAVL